MSSALSPKVQNQIAMLQQMQQQMQTIGAQKAQYEMAVREAKRAAEELNDEIGRASCRERVFLLV